MGSTLEQNSIFTENILFQNSTAVYDKSEKSIIKINLDKLYKQDKFHHK